MSSSRRTIKLGASRFIQLVLDSRAPAELARFWAAALDGFEVRPYDDAEIARLAEPGRTPETDPCVILAGPTFDVCFQEVTTLTENKRTVHLDISTPDRPLGRDRLVSLGASIVQEFDRHTWMRDPEGNDFCITDG
ncbi:MAG TPA: VOC family protein [Ilumatobacteraceae bacterium]|nr:VOC family protein [Ilumatobacteraceae bacterium]